MEERFYDEFVTWHHKTPMGIKVDEVFGMDSKSGRVWMELARQIFCEQGEPNYRVIEHYENGAPYIPGINKFISISHCSVAVAVAISNAPVGIDIESLRYLRMQRVASKFIDAVSLDSDIGSPTMLAASWSAKEAVYKLHCGNGFTSHISINYPSASHILTIRHTANYTLAVAVMR